MLQKHALCERKLTEKAVFFAVVKTMIESKSRVVSHIHGRASYQTGDVM